MKPFEVAWASSAEDAVALLQVRERAAVLAGGTDLVPLVQDGLLAPDLLVGLRDAGDMKVLRPTAAGTRIGAMVTLDELLSSRRLDAGHAAVLDAARGITSPQHRHVGTVGGELCQWPRCWYFRRGAGLLERPGRRESAVTGDGRRHAILGHEDRAYFVSASVLAPALVALRARLRVVSPERELLVRAEDFFRIPRAEGRPPSLLGEADVVAEIVMARATDVRSATYDVRRRTCHDAPVVSAAVSFRLDGDRAAEARLVLGQVAPKPWLAQRASEVLTEGRLDPARVRAAAEEAVAGARPLKDNAYKVHLAKVAARRAIELALAR